MGVGLRLLGADRGRRGDPPRYRRQPAQRADRAGRPGTRFRRRGLHSRRSRRGGPGRDSGATAVHRTHQAAPLARLSRKRSAGRRMQTEFVAVPPFWTVGQTIDYMRDDKNLPDRFSQVFVIDPTFKLLGAVDLDQILRTKRAVKIDEVMHETRHAIPADDGPGRGGARIRAVRPSVGRRRRRERAAGRRADHRRRRRRHPAGGRGGPSAHGRRRRRRTVGHRRRDIAFARAVAAGQSRHRLHLGLGHQPCSARPSRRWWRLPR